MSPERRPRPRRSVDAEEERAWVDFYRRARRDPVIAAEVLTHLDRDPDMKRNHLALFLCCRETLRRDKAHQVRNQRIGAFVRWLARLLFVTPWRALQNTGRRSRDIAVELLPEPERTPRHAVRSLASAVAPVSPLPSAEARARRPKKQRREAPAPAGTQETDTPSS